MRDRDDPDERFAEDPAPRRRRFSREDEDDRRPRRRSPPSGGGGTRIVLIVVGVVALVGCLAIAGVAAMMYSAVKSVQQAALTASQDETAENLTEIGKAFHEYNDRHGKLPPATRTTKDGRPGLSWRVDLLPFLDEEELYKRFKLDEPWDSPANFALIEEMPAVYTTSDDWEVTATRYRVFVGPRTAWDPMRGQPRIPASFPDGTSNTLLVVEAEQAVPWTKADELVYDPNGPLPPLRKRPPTGPQALLADGSIRTLDAKMPDTTLRLLIMPADGQVIPNW